MIMIRLLIADDDSIIRTGLVTILQTDPEIAVVGQAADGHEVVDFLATNDVDVALIDIRMPECTGLEAIEILRSRQITDARLVILTTFAEARYLTRAFELQVDGYILKNTAPTELKDAVHTIHRGGAVLSPSVTRWLLENQPIRRPAAAVAPGPALQSSAGGLPADAVARADDLTPQQRRVLALLSEGMSNREIGAELHLAESTIKSYVSDVLAVLGVSRRVQAALVCHAADTP